MEEVGASPEWTEFVETAVFNSNKVFATFNPVGAEGAVARPVAEGADAGTARA